MNRLSIARRATRLVSSLAVVLAAPVAFAAEPAPSYDDLQRRVAELESKLNRLSAPQEDRLDAQVVNATIAQINRDAERRSTFLAEGGHTAGYDKGFFLRSDDGNFLLKPSAVFQFRGVASSADDGSDDTVDTGFEIRRARFRFDGNVLTPDLTYGFVWDTNRQGGGVTLLDAWGQYRFGKEWAVKIGQFKESWSHEKDVSFTNLVAVDRTLLDTLLGGNLTDRVQGVSVIYGGTKDNPFRAEAAVHDGANSKNTDFRDSVAGVANPASWGAGGRVEYKVFGDWATYRDFTAKGNKEALLVVGGGGDVTQRGDADTYLATVDAQYETSTGWAAYAGVIANFTDSSAGADRTDWGFVVQGSYLINPIWEVFARYDIVVLDDDFVTSEDTFNEITAGVTYYLGKDGSALHRAKITADVTWLPDGAPSNQTGIGVLASEEEAFVFRAQVQLQL